MRIVAWALYALAAVAGWSCLSYALQKDWGQLAACGTLLAMCICTAKILLGVWM